MFKKRLLIALVLSAFVANSTTVAFAASGETKEGFAPSWYSLSPAGALVGSYRVLTQMPENGTLVSSARQARRGSQVTLTVKPDDGFELKEITVVNENEKSIKLTVKGENKYIFTMPGSDVTVDAVFAEQGTQETPEETGEEPAGDEQEEQPEEPEEPIQELFTAFAAQHVNGTLTVSPQTAQAGETITVKVTPSEGFEDAGIVIINEESQPIPIVKEESGSYSFLLPHSDVMVVPTFVKTAQGKSCDCAEKPETSTPQNPSGCLCDAGQSCCSCSPDGEPSPPVQSEPADETDKNNLEDKRPTSEPDNKQPVAESGSASQPQTEEPSGAPSDARPAQTTPVSPGSVNKNLSNSSGSSESSDSSSSSSNSSKKKTIIVNGGSNFGSTSSTASTTKTDSNKTASSVNQSNPSAVDSAVKQEKTTVTDKKDIPKVQIPNVRMLSVSVPLSLPIQTASNGTVIVPNQAAILNHSRDDNVIIANVRVKLKDGWKPVEQLDLSLRENSLDQSGKIKLTKEDWTVKARDSLPLQMKVELPTGGSIQEDDIASIEFVFDWEQ